MYKYFLSLLFLLNTFAYSLEIKSIELNELLGMSYTKQILNYKVTIPKGKLKDITRCSLIDSSGNELLSQFFVLNKWADNSIKQVKVSFATSLNAYERKKFSIIDKQAKRSSSLSLINKSGIIELTSTLAGVRIPSESKDYGKEGAIAINVPPPFTSIRGKAKWYGKAWLQSTLNILKRTVTIIADGPLYKSVAIDYTFTLGSTYNVKVTLQEGEDLVRVYEKFAFSWTTSNQSTFNFDLAKGLAPDMSVNNPIYSTKHRNMPIGSLWDPSFYSSKIKENGFPISYHKKALYGAISPWSVASGEWSHFASYNSKTGKMLGIMTTFPERWTHFAYQSSPNEVFKQIRNPHMYFAIRPLKNVPITVDTNKSLLASFPLSSGTREWAFLVSDNFQKFSKKSKKVSDNPGRDFLENRISHYLYKSLDRIKNYKLEWQHDSKVKYPHVYASLSEYEARRIKFNKWNKGGKLVKSLTDKEFCKEVKEKLYFSMDQAFRYLTDAPHAPHTAGAVVYMVVNMADMLLGRGILSADEEKKIFAKLAFFAYTMNWKGYWSPEMGYAANPNMTSFRADAVGLVGALLRDHPESPKWMQVNVKQIEQELAQWISKDGVEIESPHYVLAAWQEHVMSMVALKKQGVKDFWQAPRVIKLMEYYSAIQTPPDPEVNNQRGLLCMGNSFYFEAIRIFAYFASGLKDVNPKLASELMWRWKANGFGTADESKGKNHRAYGHNCESWFCRTNYHMLALFDSDIEPVQPKATNGASYKDFGAIMQAHFGTKYETKLFFRVGQIASHWDMDQNSIVLWAKGAPLVLDHGYGEFHPWWHSRVNINHMWDSNLGDLTQSFFGNGSSYVQGELHIKNLELKESYRIKKWDMKPEEIKGRNVDSFLTRQVIFMKDADPLGPNYFVIRDRVDSELPSEWVLWGYGKVNNFKTNPLRVVGKNGVDMLVYLLDDDYNKVGTGSFTAKKTFPRNQVPMQMKRPAGRGTLALIYPLFPSDELPKVTALPNSFGARLVLNERVDYIFAPEVEGEIKVDGISFNGNCATYSKRGQSSFYMVAGNTKLETQDLSIFCNVGVELELDETILKGTFSKNEIAPKLILGSKIAGKIKVAQSNGKIITSHKKNDKRIFIFPAGCKTFQIKI